MHKRIDALIFLLGAAVLLARKAGVPYPIFLALGGPVLGFAPFLTRAAFPSPLPDPRNHLRRSRRSRWGWSLSRPSRLPTTPWDSPGPGR